MKNKILSLLLCAAMLLTTTAFTACSDTSDKTPADDSQNVQADSAADDAAADENTPPAEETTAGPNLPENVNMDGKTFTILSQGFYAYAPLSIMDIYTDETTGDLFNDAVYERNLYMNEKYGCVVNEYATDQQSDAFSALTNAVTSDTNDFDIVLLRSDHYISAVTGGYLTDLESLTYCDYDQAWWDKDVMDQLGVAGKHFVISSGITTTDELCKSCIYFNKNLVTEFNLDSPYTLVNNGTWTFEKMMAMTSGVNSDLNSDGIWDTQDRYGITHVDDSPCQLSNGFNIRFATLNSDGVPEMTIGSEESITKIIDLITKFSDESVVFNVSHRSSNVNADETGMFLNGQSLFSVAGIYYCREMREMDQDFGIIPYPKYDEAQANYCNTTSAIALTFVAVPTTNTDYENTSIFLEDYSYQGHTNILPAFYDVLLQGKVARDEESKEMLDLIFGSSFIDVGFICAFGSIPGTLNTMNASHNANVASIITRSIPRAEKEIASFLEAFGVVTE